MNNSNAKSLHRANSVPRMLIAIGMPAAGKTTILKPLAEKLGLVYVNRDEIRQKLFGNPIVQRDKERVWKEADSRVRKAFTDGDDVIYDASFAEQGKRRDFLASMRAMGWEHIIGFYVDTPTEIARERNQNREHRVIESELEKCYIEPLRTNPPSLEDGFDELYTLKDVDELEYLFARS